MGIDDITRKAQQFLGDEKVQNALKSEKAEDVSDRILDGVAGAVNRVTGEKHADKVEKARSEADKRIGNE
ncbi:antitoxin [Cnuibacter sp. UC19_7]|uniref:antitoxin n=1 Tax=Cnuibacter sp. UC19_7 TaxID=3350166 RepID=UPI00367191E3